MAKVVVTDTPSLEEVVRKDKERRAEESRRLFTNIFTRDIGIKPPQEVRVLKLHDKVVFFMGELEFYIENGYLMGKKPMHPSHNYYRRIRRAADLDGMV